MEEKGMDKKMITPFKRFMSVLLCVAMVLPMLIVPVAAEEAAYVDEPLAVIYTASDFQVKDSSGNDDHATAKNVMGEIIHTVKDNYNRMDGAFFLGDYTVKYTLDATNAGRTAVKETLTSAWGNLSGSNIIYVQGNHDQPGFSGQEDPKTQSFEHYNVFVMDNDMFPWQQGGANGADTANKATVQETAAQLETYLKGLVDAQDDRPVFITSHVPLHFSRRSNSGMNYDNTYARLIFDVLNKYGEKLDIIFLFGHNHSSNYDDYIGGAAIYLPVGETIYIPVEKTVDKYDAETLNFTYMNGGYIGYYNGNCETQQSSAVIEVYENRIEIARYDADGEANLKDMGKTVDNITANTTVYTNSSPEATITRKNVDVQLDFGALRSGQLYKNGNAVLTVKGKYNVPYSVVWSSSNPALATVTPAGNGMSALVTGVAKGDVTVTATVTELGTRSTAGAVSVFECNFTVLDTASTEPEVLIPKGNYTYFQQVSSLSAGKVYAFIDKEDEGYWIGRQMALQYTAAGDAKENDEVGVHPENEFNAYPVDVFQLPIGDSVLTLSNISDATCWWRTSTHTNGFNVYSHEDGTGSNRYLFVAENAGSSGQYQYDAYDRDQDRIRAKSGPDHAWTYDANHGLVSTRIGTWMKYAVYYSQKDTDFSVYRYDHNYDTTNPPKQEDEGANSRVYAFEQKAISISSDITAYLKDTVGYVNKDVGYDDASGLRLGGAQTGDVIVINNGTKTVEIPVTIDMIRGSFDVTKPGVYSNLSISYAGTTIAEGAYTLVVRDSATIMHNEAAREYMDTIYARVEKMVSGRQYMIVDTDEAGIAHAMGVSRSKVFAYNVLAQQLPVDGAEQVFIDSTRYSWDGSTVTSADITASDLIGRGIEDQGNINEFFKDTFADRVEYQYAIRLVWTPTQMMYTGTSTTDGRQRITEADYYFLVSQMQEAGRNANKVLSISKSAVDTQLSLLTAPKTTTSITNEWWYHWKYDTGVHLNEAKESFAYLFYNFQNMVSPGVTPTDAINKQSHESAANQNFQVEVYGNTTYPNLKNYRRTWIYERVTGIDTVSARISDKTATVTQRVEDKYESTSGATFTGDYILVDTTRADGTVTTEQVPMTIDMLSGGFDLTKPGTYSNLTVTYQGVEICADYTLNIVAFVENHYPEFPEEGAVRIGKYLNMGTYNYLDTGVASIDLSVTGIPAQSGVDLVIILDTSSSMRNCVHAVNGGSVCSKCQGSQETADSSCHNYVDGVCTKCQNKTATAVTSCHSLDANGICTKCGGVKIDTTNSRLAVLEDTLESMLATLKEPINGYIPDIDVAIADFNGYTPINTDFMAPYNDGNKNIEVNQQVTEEKPDASDVLVPFTNIAQLDPKCLNETPKQVEIENNAGTNYDRAMELAYELLSAKQKKNALDGVSRQSVVVFMSDGAPYQYNYFCGASNQVLWNDYLAGTLDVQAFKDAVTTQCTTLGYNSDAVLNAFDDYYNSDGSSNKHWMAEAIKANPNSMVKVIDRDAMTRNHISYARGLGATIYGIGFGMERDTKIQLATINTVMESISTDESHYKAVNNNQALHDAFQEIANLIRSGSAKDAVYHDQMGVDFDLVTSNIVGGDIKLDPAPSITVKRYDLYKPSEVGKVIDDVTVTNLLVGERKFTLDGENRVENAPTILEKVTFNDDGTAAYSDKKSGNILNGKVIEAATFYYNTDKVASHDITVNGKAVSLAPETFYWIVGDVPQDELVMSYNVYLTDSMEGAREKGTYDTNNYAYLTYVNYLGKACDQSVPTPKLPWKQGIVGYAFYLVDKNGNPIVNQTTGELGSFERSVEITQPEYIEFFWNDENNEGCTVKAEEVSKILPAGYTLFDKSAEYKVTLHSNGSGTYSVKKGSVDRATTYIQGIHEHDINPVGDYTVGVSEYDTANTIVWFAVYADPAAKPDSVVIDYGIPVDIHVMVNDPHMNTNYAELVGVGAVTNTAFSVDLKDGYGLSCEGKFGTISVVDNGTNSTSRAALRYTLNKEYGMQMTEAEKFSYVVRYYGPHGKVGYHYATVTVIPAANMYYEDSFLDFENSTVANENNQNFGKWETDAAAIQISCYNEKNWNQLYAYCEGDKGAAGIWPGVRMYDTNNDGIYTAYVSADRRGCPVIFNNGDQGNATGDLQVVGNAIYKLDGSWTQNGNYESKVYFTNDSGWEHVYAYWWDGGKNNGWPGTELTQDADGRYVATVPAGMTGIIFNAGNGMPQTGDFVVEENRVYNTDGSFEYLSNNLATKRVYFDTEIRDWENVYAYWWNYADQNNGWPGTQMTYQKDTGLYYIDVPVNMTGIKFHDNKDGHTEQLDTQIIGGAEMYYRTPHWDYSSDTTDVIYDNTDSGWDTVYAYYWSGYNTSMTVWPGVRMTKGEGNLWNLTIPAEAEFIIFNGGLSQTQTADIPLASSGTTYYFDGSNNADELPDRVYYFKGTAWDQVYAYYWKGSGENADDGGKEWPGTKMNYDANTGLYSISVPAEMHSIIFNNGKEGDANVQTADLRLPAAGSTFYGDAWNNCEADLTIQQEDRPGSALDALKNFDADNVYGYDESYGIFTSHSFGSAQKVTVDTITGHKSVAPQATFTFTGTGFDVVSITDNRSGAVMVEVYPVNKDGSLGSRVRSTVVTNYYGYTYTDGKWVVKTDGSDCLYQVPVVKMTGLDYGTYRAVIRAVYMPSLDPYYSKDSEAENSYTIWLDAIRTYNPAQEDTTSNGAYGSDNEANPSLLMLQDILVKQESFGAGDASVVFIDGFHNGGKPTIKQYANQGPNNEVYLTNGQGIAFELETNTKVQPTAVHIGAKLAAGNQVTLKVNNAALTKISTASNMFYALDIDWKQTEDGYWTSGTIVVSCEAEQGNILSLTDMKVTSTNGVTFTTTTEEDADEALENATEQVVLALTRRSTMSDVRKMMRLSTCEHDWVDGNCTTPKTCSKCGETEGDVVHNYNSYHICKNCLSLEPGHIAGIYGFNVSLGGNIAVHYYVKLDDAVLSDPDAKMVFSVPESGDYYTVEVPVSEAKLVSGFYVFTCEVAAKEIASDIQAQIVTADASSDAMNYQIMTYAQSVLANPGTYAKEVSLVKALLNYSAAAQVYFDHNTGNLANDTAYMDAADKALADVDLSDYAYTVSGEQTGVSFYGANLSLESETAIKLYFTIEGDASELEMSVNGAPVTAEKNGSYYVIKISDIAAHQLGNMYEIKIGGLTLTYGAFSYGNKAMSGSNEKLQDTIKALHAYYLAAVDYQN